MLVPCSETFLECSPYFMERIFNINIIFTNVPIIIVVIIYYHQHRLSIMFYPGLYKFQLLKSIPKQLEWPIIQTERRRVKDSHNCTKCER